MTGHRALQATASLSALAIALIAGPALAQQVPVDQQPVVTAPAATVQATPVPAEDDEEQPRVETGTPGQVQDVEPNQQDQLDGLEVDNERQGLWEGSTLVFKPRTYYLNRDRDTRPDNVGWALGGGLEYRSGWWNDTIQIAATLYTSQILYGPEERDGTLLFAPGPEPITVLGEAYLTARLGDDNVFRIGRQSFDLPWLSKHDIRMIPNTFEAVAVGRQAKKGWAYVAAYVSAIKLKNSDEFVSMSEAAGAADTDNGVVLTGVQYTLEDGSLIGATNQATVDVMNTFFIKGERSFPLGEDTSIRLYGQYTDQRSIGESLIGDFETYLFAVKGELFYKDFSFRLAASTAGDEKGLQSPYGGPPNYLSIIVDNFDRAGEDAVMIGASYDFKGVGLNGLSAFSNISSGRTPDVGPTASPDETEYDLTVDYRFAEDSVASGLWIRARGAWIDQDEAEGGDDFFDFRIIVNYSYDLL